MILATIIFFTCTPCSLRVCQATQLTDKCQYCFRKDDCWNGSFGLFFQRVNWFKLGGNRVLQNKYVIEWSDPNRLMGEEWLADGRLLVGVEFDSMHHRFFSRWSRRRDVHQVIRRCSTDPILFCQRARRTFGQHQDRHPGPQQRVVQTCRRG